MALKLDDIREYVVPLFVAEDPHKMEPHQPVVVSRDRFLGTAFFVSRNGIAITAAHLVPDRSSIPEGLAFLAMIWIGNRPHASLVQLATQVDGQDIAFLKFEHCSSKYLPLSFEPVHMGEDIATVGVPLHSVSGNNDYEFRCLKGHVSRVARTLELSCPAPKGMSGSPILVHEKVVGVMSFNARGEAFEDQSFEEDKTIGDVRRVTKTVTMAVTNYGQAEPISALGSAVLPFTEGLSLEKFLERVNRPS